MKYILDTHILLWWLTDHKSLSQKHREIISDPKHIIFISAVTIWEIEIKKALGKLTSPEISKQVLLDSQFIELPITIEHVSVLSKLANHHNDPFDRLLICQSIVEKATLLTEDDNIKQYV